ncbi:glycosyltransferase [Desulfovibrio psychrotolerans]|uniref:Glycosyl transferase n=1 Tax=Desulfovibrio psychrotolerans TaxID=415242 RepID=A0A7J0BXJ8_9BACT|nr:glycosyltransferase [Desulfovibrio psychrotolerans]GFM38426.1 glycosyl transferase [Desulfovibrio psychrotolerans]
MPSSPVPPGTMPHGVHLHSLLALRGGAARIAAMLRDHLACGIASPDGSGRSGRLGHLRGTVPGTVQNTVSDTVQKHFQPPVPVSCSCEIADEGAISSCAAVSPADVALAVPGTSLLHLHGTQDWTACLQGVACRELPCVITLHDCSLLTGGCVYPLDCPGATQGCLSPCPRGYPHAAAVQRAQHAAVRAAIARLVAPSGWLRAMAKAALPDVPCTVIPNGVETPDPAITRSLARNRFGLAPGARLVLFMAHGGEQAAYKSGGRWREVWHSVRTLVPGAVCFMVGGDGHAREDSLVLWPYVDRERAQLFMAAADCFAYPTLADNHPLVVLEAMAAGCPVVSFAVGGVAEQVVPGKTGVLVQPGDWQAFTGACVSVLTGAAEQRRMRHESQELFTRRFTVQRMVRDYRSFYSRF